MISEWVEQQSFPKIVRKLKHNDYTIVSAKYPKIVALHNLTRIPIELEYDDDKDMWFSDFNAFFSNMDVRGFGCILGSLDDGKWLLRGDAFPSKVVGAVKRQMKTLQDDRSWSAKWHWAYERKYGNGSE